jgi:hypothetical protein
MQNEECRTGLPLNPKPVGCPVEPAFCVGSNLELVPSREPVEMLVVEQAKK